MTELIEKIKGAVSVVSTFTLINAVEVLIIAWIIYEILVVIKNTRAWTVLKGIVVILGFTLIAWFLHLDTILWILEKISSIAVLGLLIIFMPELRNALMQLGSNTLGVRFFRNSKNEGRMSDDSQKQLIAAVFEMAAKKTGALIVIENNESLDEYIRTGIMVKGIISSGLLINIFEKNTPLHDGAVVIRGNEVTAATCYLPLSANDRISKDLGTRHRAALGVSETTDSLTIVVSEENGHVTVARNGRLKYISSGAELEKELAVFLQNAQEERETWWKGRNGDEG